ncbi:SPRY domain-containing SOCS box protein 3-like [Lineus longissimus]|uniref:SPRY domain-containing SOCS box protein 3-like n=1 Tax=Lineus longissimus TaxID=88925 RepID=UPI002B4DB9EA
MGDALILRPLDAFRSEFFNDEWVWDQDGKSPEAQLSNNSEAVYFNVDPVDGSTGTSGVRGNKGFTEGEHYWEITFTEPCFGTSVMVGVGTKKALLHTNNYQYVNLLGRDTESWGLTYKGTIWHNGMSRKYCKPFYEPKTVIGCHLNLYDGTLTFYKNGQNLGVAFRGLNRTGQPLYPLTSSTSTNTEIEVGVRTQRHLTLQEMCVMKVLQNIHYKQDDIDNLPLPNIVKNHLKAL